MIKIITKDKIYFRVYCNDRWFWLAVRPERWLLRQVVHKTDRVEHNISCAGHKRITSSFN